MSVSTACLTSAVYFHYIKNMETERAVHALAALAQDSRLAVFRLLVQAGPEGINAGTIATRLAIPSATLSFHLARLAHAGLIRVQRHGRSLVYAADFSVMNDLIGFLTESCCGGRSCAGADAKPARARRGS